MPIPALLIPEKVFLLNMNCLAMFVCQMIWSESPKIRDSIIPPLIEDNNFSTNRQYQVLDSIGIINFFCLWAAEPFFICRHAQVTVILPSDDGVKRPTKLYRDPGE